MINIEDNLDKNQYKMEDIDDYIEKKLIENGQPV